MLESTLTVAQISSLRLVSFQRITYFHNIYVAGEQMPWTAAQGEETKLCKQSQPHPLSSHHTFVQCGIMWEPTF